MIKSKIVPKSFKKGAIFEIPERILSKVFILIQNLFSWPHFWLLFMIDYKRIIVFSNSEVINQRAVVYRIIFTKLSDQSK
jgi:hypothetical protein